MSQMLGYVEIKTFSFQLTTSKARIFRSILQHKCFVFIKHSRDKASLGETKKKTNNKVCVFVNKNSGKKAEIRGRDRFWMKGWWLG